MENHKAINRVIPEGEINCIWVEAGLVSYKLCDRHYECENCPFDQVMRRQPGPASESSTTEEGYPAESKSGEKDLSRRELVIDLVNAFFAAPLSACLPADRLYSRNHVWSMKVDRNLYRLGLDHYAAFFLETAGSVILSQPGSTQAHNNPLAWLICQDGTVAVRSPISGRVLRNNPQLKDSPSLIRNDPYENGWISELETEEEGDSVKWFSDSKDVEPEYIRQFDRLKNEIVNEYEKASSAGVTLLDGGTRPGTLKDFLGPQKYVSLLQRLMAARI